MQSFANGERNAAHSGLCRKPWQQKQSSKQISNFFAFFFLAFVFIPVFCHCFLWCITDCIDACSKMCLQKLAFSPWKFNDLSPSSSEKELEFGGSKMELNEKNLKKMSNILLKTEMKQKKKKRKYLIKKINWY